MAIFKKCSFPAVKSGCPEGWHLYQDTCYSLRGTGRTDTNAFHECSFTYGSDIVKISTEGENNFVKELLRKNAADDVTSAWIGMWKRENGKWKHMENYADWATSDGPQSPDLQCAIFSKDADWAWRETECGEEMSSRASVCERAASQTECFGGSCYDLHKEMSDIDDAHAMCKRLGGYVVEINTEEEQNGVKDFLNRAEVPVSPYLPDTNGSVWLGASEKGTSRVFYWKNSGTEVGLAEFSGWAAGEPHEGGRWKLWANSLEHCTELDGNRDWQWNDVMCGDRRAVLCERPEVSPISG